MKKDDQGRIIFSPTDLTRYFESEFAAWMDRYDRYGKEEGTLEGWHRNPKDPLQEILKDRGNTHEGEVVVALEAHVSVVRLERSGNRDEDLAKTREALKSGAPVLYQAALRAEHLFGYADLLERRTGKSDLGDYYYVPIDVKIAASPKPTAVLQLCAYAEMLLEAQGRLPEEIIVVTFDGVRHSFRTEAFYAFYLRFKQRFLEFQNGFATDKQPLPLKRAEHRDWSIYARKVLHACDDVALTARVRQSHLGLLREAGITTLSALAVTKVARIKGIPDSALVTMKKQAALQVASRGLRVPLFEVNPHPSGKRLGLAMLPDPHSKDIFFDMEGYSLIGKNGLEYLYGVAERGKSDEGNYTEFWAYTPADEMKTFRKFVEWAYARWQANPGMHIYHFAPYEPSTLKRLMGTYGVGEALVNDLLRNEVFVDLYAVVGQGLLVGTYGYGLKLIERLYYPDRTTEVESGAQSAVEFANWLTLGDPAHPEKSESLGRIRRYNQDDCWSTKDLEAFLQEIRREKQIPYISLKSQLEERESKGEKKDSAKEECARLAAELLSTVPEGKRRLPLDAADPATYVRELLADCLEFHRREDDPDWADYFRRLDLSQEELTADPDALVGVTIVSQEGDTLTCTFPPEQDTRFRKGTTVLILENRSGYEELEIVEWNLVEGRLTLHGTPRAIPAAPFTLAPARSRINKDGLRRSLLRQARKLDDSARCFGQRKAVHNLLLRRAPDIYGLEPGDPILPGEADPLEEITQAVLQMNDTVLCIQGPPGTGKTYTGSHVIVALLEAGKTVAVSSNSHKAINHLLFKIEAACPDREICRPVKISSSDQYDEETAEFKNHGVELKRSSVEPETLFTPSRKPVYLEGPINLIGATAFYLSKEAMEDKVDYLFVDEATQVALPNLLAMAPCARNIVLLGDQMQLEQPTKGTHPGDSGSSGLVHLTGGRATVPKDFGIFLPTSYRMHPDVCGVISSCFYEGMLQSEPGTVKQSILWNDSRRDTIRSNGIQFLPVPHAGNRHGSVEEVDAIEKLVASALGSKWTDKDGTEKKLYLHDILIVAPYNYQVALLTERLGPEARVGSVDKFQGQEAPIVILSLCASSGAEAPRGLGFLLNRNRLNVALSRAKCLALIVGAPSIGDTVAASLATMELLSLFYWLTSEEVSVRRRVGAV